MHIRHLRSAAAVALLAFSGGPLRADPLVAQPFLPPPMLPPPLKPAPKLPLTELFHEGSAFSDTLNRFAAPRPALAPPAAPAAASVGPTRCQIYGDSERDAALHQVHVDLVAVMAPNEINNPVNARGGKDQVLLRSYGGCLSGPVVEAQPGDTLRVNLVNRLDAEDPSCKPEADMGPGCFNTINVHYHGMHVSPTGNSDNVLLSVVPQTAFPYEINIPFDHPSGTFWYHPHRHGSTALQVASGASGPLIIRGDRPYREDADGKPVPGDVDTILHGPNDPKTPGRNDTRMPEQIFLLQQIPYACFDGDTIIRKDKKKDGPWVCPADKVGVVKDFGKQLDSPTVWDESGRFTSINGVVQPTLKGIKAGEVQRWRFIHAGIHDTVNLQIVPLVPNAPDAKGAAPLAAAPPMDDRTIASAEQTLLAAATGTPREQADRIAQLCPVYTPNSGSAGGVVPQFEIATDGLTRSRIVAIGDEQTPAGYAASNFLQPGYRSDVLVVFPRKGIYCVLNRAAPKDERANAGKGGQGPNVTQLLATVVVDGDAPSGPVAGPLFRYVTAYLADTNPALPMSVLTNLRQNGDLTPWRGMPEEPASTNSDNPRLASFYIGRLDPTNPQTFGFFLNAKSYDPNRVDMNLQLGATEDWTLTSTQEPHIFHIHVNPFEVMDVRHKGKSIFGPDGECAKGITFDGLQGQYCNMDHVMKDTVFVQNDYEVHIRTTYDRYIGEFVIHCHILDHEDGGMMSNILVQPDVTAPNGGLGMAGMTMTSNGTMAMPMSGH